VKSWYRIENKAAGDIPEILIYQDIADYGITADDFRRDLFSLNAKEISLRVNSRGGDVFQGVAIHNALKDHPAKITAYIDSLAASISSYIPMAADKIVMAKNARIMIHKAWGLEIGNADEMRKTANLLDDIDTILIDAYSERTGIAKADIKQMLADETWMNPKVAKEKGFIDEIAGESDTKAQYDLSPFSNVPDDVKALFGKASSHTERDIEQLLRDAGVSRAKAKAAVAAIKTEGQRDSDSTSLIVAAIEQAAANTRLIAAMRNPH
jgi:ATP-dependent protease ClpP protease subunit